MNAQYLIAASAGLVLAMGTGHLLLTFFSDAFAPRDAGLFVRMQSAPTHFSRRMLMGPAWVGFNASHSVGPILFGLVYGWLALEHAEFLFASPFLLALGACFLGFYVLIAIRYWFWAPLTGLLIASAFYAGGIVAASMA
ncbi:MAG TPA: hypothetical protein VLW75_05555 [Rhizomicrobium sp.]|nr:hypothetical protein [Rhizomicrobium sp.]